ncbi:N-(5'-phosphoribosyl)anthranilate isomerase [Kordiimonas sediminis]|uniref:N-(5'-phosphoribosyl)anthranilate isomerase n=1 Tax=Kordiimonas sediminis TaxID=1735581 RepID=A0A919APD9_9PROT|nr:phosphoribosylanthranilate isomerase [Kordiimonas sediminis]GHF16747.1 N-(5'-phosphoribosyl)anthranilate isomerase [Kordiimonas sediminis]
MPVDVKICGLTHADHAHLAVDLGARWLGFVHFEKSPRHVSIETARALAPRLPKAGERVGVFVNANLDTIQQMTDILQLDWIQLHGNETPEMAAHIRSLLGRKVIKAIAVSEAEDLVASNRYEGSVDAFLFDAKPPKGAVLPGGNAVSFPWQILAGKTFPVPWLLAGGLTAENLHDAVTLSGAGAVDISSGVESAPGQKDPKRIEDFLKAAKTTR